MAYVSTAKASPHPPAQLAWWVVIPQHVAPNLELLFPKYFSGTYGISVQFFFIDPFFSNGVCRSLYLMLTIRIICSTYFYCDVQCFSLSLITNKLKLESYYVVFILHTIYLDTLTYTLAFWVYITRSPVLKPTFTSFFFKNLLSCPEFPV